MKRIVFHSGGMTLEVITYFIGKMRKSLGSPRTLALTATATTQVIHDIYTFLGLNKENTTYFQGHAFLKNREIDVISVEGLRSKMLYEL